MKNIEVAVLNQAHESPGGMMMFLASLTQRGHQINNLSDLLALYNTHCVHNPNRAEESSEYAAKRRKILESVSALPHGTIKRFAPITIAIVGASRRFLAQARTNQVGIDYVSGSLQYSNYSGATTANFVVPYAVTEADAKIEACTYTNQYLWACEEAMQSYTDLAKVVGNDAAGYAAPQGLRNILIMQGNHQSWNYFIQLRSCLRNTVETRYVALLIWQALLQTEDGPELFGDAGPTCRFGKCLEGKMCCGKPLDASLHVAEIIERDYPLLKES